MSESLLNEECVTAVVSADESDSAEQGVVAVQPIMPCMADGAVDNQAACAGTLEELEECEKAVRANLTASFVEVGRALKRIHDGELYRAKGVKTFGTYCSKVFQMGRSTAYLKIAEAEAYDVVHNGRHFPVLSERHYRMLVGLKNAEPPTGSLLR
ncbi:MAG: hypothetical protein ACYDBB_05085 [Armatimonadota bacterium]